MEPEGREAEAPFSWTCSRRAGLQRGDERGTGSSTLREISRTDTYEKINQFWRSEDLREAHAWREISPIRCWRGGGSPYRTFAMAQVTSREKIYTLQNSLQKLQINCSTTREKPPLRTSSPTSCATERTANHVKRRGWRATRWARRWRRI
jgi:hypothetical protein